MTRLNLPCWLTIARIALTPLILVLVLSPWPYACLMAAGLCAAAGLSDIADGYLARRSHCTSKLGANLDLLADKLLVLCVIGGLTFQGMLPLWVLLVVLLRDGVVMSLRAWGSREGVSLAPSFWGKAKTAVSVLALLALLLARGLSEPLLSAQSLPSIIIQSAFALGWSALFLAVALTVVSGADYVLVYTRRVRQPA